jgi:hypothetical protein
MKKLAPHEKYCSQLAAQAWTKIRKSKLTGGKKIGRCPEVVFKELDDELNGLAFPDHIELNISRLESPDRDLFLCKTTLHEVAHVAEYRIAGIMTHGPLWHAIDDLIGGDGQFHSYRVKPKTSFWEEVFVNVNAVTVLGMMVMIGFALIMRFPVWWGYLIGCVIGGFGVFGLLAGLAELVKFLAGTQKAP